MGNRLLAFFATAPDRPRLDVPAGEIAGLYERRRLSVFLSLTFGYGLFYTCRMNFSLVKKPLLDEGLLDATQMGLVGSAMLFVYAFGRLTNGFLADRANIRRFMATALLLSSIVNLLLGANSFFTLFLVGWAMNGWFQSVGSAPSVASLSQWFARGERGTRYGIWSISHSIGEAITFGVTASLIAALGWRWGFFGPGLVCLIAALVLYRTLGDRPQTYGLPPVHEYKGEAPDPASQGASVGRLQLEVLRNPGVWLLASASACLYVARYGIGNWGPLYLTLGKGYSQVEAGSALAIYPIAEIFGSVTSGWVSDRVFGSRRNVPALLYGLLEIAALVALYYLPPGHRILDAVALAGFGFGLGGLLVYLGGLMAVDLVSHRAAGAAMGLVGLFSYLVAAVQDTVTGYLIDNSKVVVDGHATYSFGRVFAVWTGAMVLSTVLAAGAWAMGIRRRRMGDSGAQAEAS